MDKIEKINKLTETKTPTSGRRTNVSNTNNNKISNFEKKANEHNAPTSGRKIAINNVNNKNKISDIEAKANEHNTLISERRTNDSNIRSNINIVKKTETENKLKESENPISANINKFDRKTDSTNAAKAIPSHNEHNSTERQAKTSAIEKELSSTQEIVQLQNIEYNEALKEAQIRTELEKQTAEEKANEEEEMQKLINSLPPEPAIGVTIAVLLKNGKRVMRRFDPKSKGIYVYVWVLMQINENTPDEKLSLDSFDVKLSVSAKKIEKEQTLEEQNISGRVFAIVDIF
ncbi:hypothetical protein GPJ56_000525 [Histomonas meleagridis]|uniref:uncharacterized protein n=1 Tax=Histomonas meleagridis TaxID=135588 RepID=UPI00355A44DB|nr:hypothetical protein GPJ56_000525 [Histomonas meleagridis]KAH0796435.1 hypothetical protein GO595_010328 [Histomonas meleagridis]